MDFFHRSEGGERAIVIQPYSPGADPLEDLAEFVELARSAGAEVLESVSARVDKPSPRFYLGSGKVDQIAEIRTHLNADLVLVNAALSPVQERNLEAAIKCRVVDRTGLILDIFAQRARTHEGKLQVELAQLKHLSTRLVRGWTHLERQRGGAIGLRGPGETQLELDRRLLADRVKMLEARLQKVAVQRAQARRKRERGQLPVVTLVGYTNAGKSTLFNQLTGAQVYAADLLFATLDPTLRKLEGLPSGPALIADTVGFVHDLPHDLIAAFRSTLSEVRDADLLLHVVDASSAEREQRIDQVNQVLRDVGAEDVPQILVFNKIDRMENTFSHRERVYGPKLDRVWISAVSGEGMDLLRGAVAERLTHARVHCELTLPHAAARLRARLFAAGVVQEERADEDCWVITIDAPENRIEPLFGLSDGDGDWLRRHLSSSFSVAM